MLVNIGEYWDKRNRHMSSVDSIDSLTLETMGLDDGGITAS